MPDWSRPLSPVETLAVRPRSGLSRLAEKPDGVAGRLSHRNRGVQVPHLTLVSHLTLESHPIHLTLKANAPHETTMPHKARARPLARVRCPFGSHRVVQQWRAVGLWRQGEIVRVAPQHGRNETRKWR